MRGGERKERQILRADAVVIGYMALAESRWLSKGQIPYNAEVGACPRWMLWPVGQGATLPV